jgi:hypothetical protein
MSVDEKHEACIEFVVPCCELEEIAWVALGIELDQHGLEKGYSDNVPQGRLDEIPQLFLGNQLKERWPQRMCRRRCRWEVRQELHRASGEPTWKIIA